MSTQLSRRVTAALLITALAALGLAGSAQAKLTGNYTKFAQCPYANLEVKKCIYSMTDSGEVVLGSKKVPIVNPVVLQGGYGKQVEEEASPHSSPPPTASRSPKPPSRFPAASPGSSTAKKSKISSCGSAAK